MSMTSKVVALKGEGTHPPSEGLLARFAEVHIIKTPADASAVAKRHPGVVLIDVRMEVSKAQEVLQALRSEGRIPVILLVDFEQPPARLRLQLIGLAKAVAPQRRRALNMPRIARILGTSQEGLSRVLNVSAKTAHRWMKGTRPRRKPELERLSQIISALQDTLPGDDAIRSYLNHPNPSFVGETPVNLLTRGEFDRVAADVQALAEGVYL